MAKATPDAVFDAMLAEIATGTVMVVCNAQPTTWTELITTFALADVVMVAGHGNDYTIADGDVSGRKVTTAVKNGVNIDTTGTATHVGIGRTADTTLLYVTTCTSQALTSGNPVNVPAWRIEVADPT